MDKKLGTILFFFKRNTIKIHKVGAFHIILSIIIAAWQPPPVRAEEKDLNLPLNMNEMCIHSP